MSKLKRISIFRQECLDYKRFQYGDVVLTRPISFHLITLLLLLFISVAFIYLSVASYTKYYSFNGYLKEGKGVSLISSVNGYIAKEFVNPGDTVKKGQKIFEISSSSKTQDYVYATVSGEVDLAKYKIGEYVFKGKELIKLYPSIKKFDVVFEFSAQALSLIKIGQKVEVKLQSYIDDSNIDVVGKVTYISKKTTKFDSHLYKVLVTLQIDEQQKLTAKLVDDSSTLTLFLKGESRSILKWMM